MPSRSSTTNVLTGAAHLYFRPFENLSPWGGSGWRDRRQVLLSPHRLLLPFIYASSDTLIQSTLLHRYSRIPLYPISNITPRHILYISPHMLFVLSHTYTLLVRR